MSKGLEARINKLEAIEEIKNLQARYAYLIDSLQIEKIPDLFADSFMAEYDTMGTFRTKSELFRFFETFSTVSSMMCHHQLTPLIELDGDMATGIWYLFGPFTLNTPEGKIAVWCQGKYENEYVKENGEWKFRLLKFKYNLLSPYEDGWVKTRMMGR